MDDQELDKATRIDRYLKGEMDNEEKRSFEYELDQNKELKRELEKTEITSQAVKYDGLRTEVSDVRQRMLAEEGKNTEDSSQRKPVERPLPIGFYAFRVAASLLLVLLAFAGIQMAVIDPQGIYQDKINFEVVDVVERSDEESGTLSSILEAYQQENYQDAVAIYADLSTSSVKERYIAAAAYLKLNEYETAAELYQNILDESKQPAAWDYWEQRAAYNLAITDVQLGSYDTAINLLEQLKTNDEYGDYFDQLVSDYALWKLRLLDFKDSLL